MSLVLAVMGCGPTIPIVKNVPVFPPDALVQDCPVAAPPDRQAYKDAGVDATREQAAAKREQMLTEHAGEQMSNILKCNGDKRQLREWKQKQQELYKAPSAVKKE